MAMRFLLVMCATCFCIPALAAASGSEPVELRCEYFQSPLNVDVPHPRLSWIFTAPQRGAAQTAFQVLAASTPQLLAADTGDLWDTGKTVSSDSIQIAYSGKPLTSGERCFWKVRVWDEADHPMPWSQPASWSMGKLFPADWTAKWIGAGLDAAADSAIGSSVLGYHAAVTQQADDLKWVQVDLGKSVPIDRVKLHALNHEVPGFGFPIRFTITASDNPTFSNARTIADQSSSDYPNPGAVAVTFKADHIAGRYVRVTASRLFRRSEGDHSCCFALAELEVFSGGNNLALHAPVTALDSVEGYRWGISQLTDGLGLAPDNTGAPKRVSTITTLPIFRKAFPITKPVSRAVLYLCGLGQYELHLNGSKIDGRVLEPGWTDYRKTCLYQAYDLTKQLRSGANIVGVMLGNGMYNVATTPGRYSKFSASMGAPKLIAQLDITYSDGTTQTIATDESWKVTGGPITFSSTYGGEDYDARLESPSWDSATGHDSTWQLATETTGPGGKLTGSSQSAPNIIVAAILKAKKVTHPAAGAWVYDLGQNCSMMPEITVTGPAGAVVRMTPGEVLLRDGTVSQEPSGGPTYFSYTLKGTGSETWAPRFTYYGSRYVQLFGAVPAGVPNPNHLPVVNDLHGLFVTSSSPPAGEFSCSNDLFNQTANIIRCSMRNNMMSILTDCPHREKLGWLEQVHLVGPSLMYNFEIPGLFSKMCADIADAQTENGLVPDIAPEYPVFRGGFRDSPEWGSAAVLIPWQVYQWYGDTQILARHYETMKRYVAYLGTTAKDNIVSHGLGDWYDLGPNPPGYAQLTPISLTATAFYYRDITILQRSAKLLGHDDDAKRYGELAAKVRDSFNNSLYHPETHSYATGSQTANAIPLVMGLAPESDRPAIVENIVKDIRARHNGLTAGDIGYRYLLRALADGGRSDVIFDMNSRSDRPGYGMMLAKGATSLTEAWDARVDSSQDHFMLGHIMEWFYGDLAGIQPDPDGVGFKKIIIKPTPVGDVTWAKASYSSVRGTIQTSWTIHENTFSLDVQIPAGCTAAVYLPRQTNSIVTEDGKLVAEMKDSTSRSQPSVPSVIHIASGAYHFESRAK